MRSDDLTSEQTAEMRDAIAATTYYLRRVRERIDKLAFPKDDQLRLKVEAAHDAMHSLWVELHYLSCKIGGGRPRE